MKTLRVLHVEDEPNARLMVKDLLGSSVELASVPSAEDALARLKDETFDLTLLDWVLPGMDGGAFLASVRESGRAGRVVVTTAVGTMERALEAMRGGAFDFLVKPVDPDALLQLVEKVARGGTLLESAGRSRPSVERTGSAAILGKSHEVLTLKARLELVATSDASVLIVGESGTGKELVARALHEVSGRHRARLVTVNCAAIPDTLFESEMFGHKRGAFTGATGDRPGLVEQAAGGTLFLDEVGELSPASQAKLLRALQDRRVRRVGETRDQSIDVRVIAATNRDLEAEAERGAFREDLLYRLDVIRLEVPPLRERIGDLPELLDHFLDLHARAYGRPAPKIAAEDVAFLESLEWPGNIRELENVAKRIVLLGAPVAIAELQRKRAPAPQKVVEKSAPPPLAQVRPLKDTVADASRAAIVQALKATNGSRTEAAALLGISRKTLFNKMQELGIREESSFSSD